LCGHVDGDNYNLIRAPGLAKVLSLTSLTAIGSMLAGSGIPFSTLRGDFAYSEDRLVVENLLAYGGALGVTASGHSNWVLTASISKARSFQLTR